MKEKEMIEIAHLIDKALRNKDDEKMLLEVKKDILELTKKFPLY